MEDSGLVEGRFGESKPLLGVLQHYEDRQVENVADAVLVGLQSLEKTILEDVEKAQPPIEKKRLCKSSKRQARKRQ